MIGITIRFFFRRARRWAETRRGKEPAAVKATPEDKVQTNFTDPEAEIVKRSNKGFGYCCNAQAVVDSAHQIIVAAEVCIAANDKRQAVPMARAAVDNLAAAVIERPRDDQGQPLPIPNTADNGYYSAENVHGVEAVGLDPYFAVGRQKHNAPATAGLRNRLRYRSPLRLPWMGKVADAHPKETIANKLRTLRGRVLYAGASTSWNLSSAKSNRFAASASSSCEVWSWCPRNGN